MVLHGSSTVDLSCTWDMYEARVRTEEAETMQGLPLDRILRSNLSEGVSVSSYALPHPLFISLM